MKSSSCEIKQKIWTIPTVPKIKAFIWKYVCDAIHVVELLEKEVFMLILGVKFVALKVSPLIMCCSHALLLDKFGLYPPFLVQLEGLMMFFSSLISITF